MTRRSSVCVLIPALLYAAAQADEKNQAQPVITHKVEPDYGPDLEKSHFVDPVQVRMVVDEDGVPYSLIVNGDLPDSAVHALAQWRFRPFKSNGDRAPFETVLIVPVRRPLNQESEMYLRRTWSPGAKELTDRLKKGTAFAPADAARMEQSIDADPEDTEGRRITLLAYYAGAAAQGASVEEIRKARARHIAWLVQNRPDLDFLGGPLAIINAAGEPLADPAASAQIRRLWINQLNLEPTSIEVAEHATNFLRLAAPEQAEQALALWRTRNLRAVVWLGDLYGLAALGVTSLDPKTGFPASAARQLPGSAFARKARAELASTDDARLLFSALAAVTLGGRSLSRAGQLPAGYAGLCEDLLKHARKMFPATAASCDPAVPLPENKDWFAGPVQRIRVGGNVQQANLVKQPRPQYPREAKSRHIQGIVRFNAIIGKDGKIASLSLVDGVLALYDSARTAVLQWEYKPTLLNGQPVEVATVIDVNYTLR
jgi:TonB family protein